MRIVATVGTIVALGGLFLHREADPLDESPLRPLLAHGILVTGGLLAIAAAVFVVGSRKR